MSHYFRNLTVVSNYAQVSQYQHEEECGARTLTPELLAQDAARMKAWKQRRNIFLRRRSAIRIPVYVHVLQPSLLQGRISQGRIQEYMDYLNNAFANSQAPFHFELVRTTWTFNAKWSTGCGDVAIERALKTKLKVGRADTLNVYFCDKILDGSTGSQYAGYAYPPFRDSDKFIRDGVVLAKDASDNGERGDQRLNTFVHEVVCTGRQIVTSRLQDSPTS